MCADKDVIVDALLSTKGIWVRTASESGRYLGIFDRRHDLEMYFSANGRLTKLVHWQPVVDRGDESYASRQPIERDKRAYALKIINEGGIT